jgi:peptidoglycan-associated lipoprotein
MFSLLFLICLLGFSCKKNVAAAPPPPPPPVQPPPPPPVPAVKLGADPTTIERGQSLTLSWTSSNSGAVRIEPGIGDVTTSGTRQISPTSSVTYTATASGPGGSATDTVRITVTVPPPPAAPPPPPKPSATIADLFRDNVREVLFDYDKANIRADQVSKLQSSAAFLTQNPGVRLMIEGHADERGSQEYNLALGDQRANAVKQFLVAQGIAESRMSTVSYGEERPQCSEQTEDCFQRNRRADFRMQ